MFNESIKITGRVSIKLFNSDGIMIDQRKIDNLVVTTGRNFIASRMKDATATAMTHIGAGTGSNAAVIGDSTLQTPLAGGRNALTGTTVTNNTITYTTTIPSGASFAGAISEVGLFNAASAGTMLARTVFAVINKATGDSMDVSWTITIS